MDANRKYVQKKFTTALSLRKEWNYRQLEICSKGRNIWIKMKFKDGNFGYKIM